MFLVVHGGAGTLKDEESAEELNAALLGYAERVLRSDTGAVDSAEACVRFLEEDLRFNAGPWGSVRQSDGIARMDASLMEGKSARLGTVTGLSRQSHPISFAREIFERDGEVAFNGAVYEARRELRLRVEAPPQRRVMVFELGGDTVGAIAVGGGEIAVASSTGGLPGATPGRISDVALPGAGFFATHRAAAMGSGMGDLFARTNACASACALVEAGVAPQEAAEKTMKRILEVSARSEGNGGIIVVSAEGTVGKASDTVHFLSARSEGGLRRVLF